MIILGISAYFHDSAAAILCDGELIAAAQEERFSRIKNDAAFPVNAIKYCLDESGYSINQLDAIAFYDKPLLKFERLLETYYAYAPKGLVSFLKSMPVWIKEKLFIKNNIRKSIDELEKADWKRIRLLFPEHHLSHAASAFYPSSFNKAGILTIDGVGEWATASICLGEENRITVLKELHFPHSLGLLYSAFTYYCGFSVNSGEYKLMGLAPYGTKDSEKVKSFIEKIKSDIVEIKEDGSFVLNQEYFNYATGLTMVKERKWESLFGFGKRKENTEIGEEYKNLAFAIQQVTEEIVVGLCKEVRKITGASYLCVAGGVGLNGVAMGKVDQLQIFEDIFVQPAAGDAGGALGAAYAAQYIYYDRPRDVVGLDSLKGCYLGPEYTNHDILKTARKNSADYEIIEDEDVLLGKVAELIGEGKVVGWFQGRMEFGPRSLGSRSILADARDPDMQRKLNLAIKFREGFRPFAPIVSIENAARYFEQERPSPYMMFVKPVVKERQHELPSVTHVDGTARLQTVHKETNPLLWKLLNEFQLQTGCPVIINTSFNVKDEPIVNTPEEAYNCFMRTGMDHLIAGNFIFSKKLSE